MPMSPHTSRNFIDHRTGETLFEMEFLREDTAVFSIHRYDPGHLSPFKTWVHETLGTASACSKPYYLVIDMSRMAPLSTLSYEDCFAMTYRTSEDMNLERLATIFIMPSDELSYGLYKALMARDGSAFSSVHRMSSVEEAIEWISQRKSCNR